MTETDPNQPGPAPHAMPETSGKAIASLVVAIVGLLVCMFLGGIIAIILGNQALREISASGGRLTGDGLAKAGVIIGWVDIGLSALIVLFWIVGGIMGAVAAA